MSRSITHHTAYQNTGVISALAHGLGCLWRRRGWRGCWRLCGGIRISIHRAVIDLDLRPGQRLEGGDRCKIDKKVRHKQLNHVTHPDLDQRQNGTSDHAEHQLFPHQRPTPNQ